MRLVLTGLADRESTINAIKKGEIYRHAMVEAIVSGEISLHPQVLKPAMVLTRDLVVRDRRVLLSADQIPDESLHPL